jgi:hypothetical protein
MIASLRSLIAIEADFPAVAGGARPFDMQNGLTAAEVFQQLPSYGDEARRLYGIFTAIDYVFPFAAGLFLAAVIAFCLRRAFPHLYAALDARHLLPVFMLGTLFDWCENVAAITAILSWPDTTQAMALALVVAKRLKLACLFVTQPLALVLLIITAVKWLRARLAPA